MKYRAICKIGVGGVGIALVWLVPLFWSNAQVLQLTGSRRSYEVGDSISVQLRLNTEGASINTVSGTIDIPADSARLSDLRYGNSIVSLWVEKPSYNASNGTISFSGGIPGGYAGSDGPILSFLLTGKVAGAAAISILNPKILLNDGLGTEVQNVKTPQLSITITPAPPKPDIPTGQKSEPPPAAEVAKDETPPEPFVPLVSRHPTVGDNKYFVSFFAVDKDSGVSYYELRERPRIITRITEKFDTDWVRVQNPHILSLQYWPAEVTLRAYDQAGNFTEASAEKPSHPAMLWGVALALFAAGIIAHRLLKSSPRGRRRVV